MNEVRTYEAIISKARRGVMRVLHDQTQDLYDALTCAGLRTDLWPEAPGDAHDNPARALEEAFERIERYLEAVEARETS